MSDDARNTSGLDDLLADAPRWIGETGPAADFIVTSRVRLARNIASLPFPAVATPDQHALTLHRTEAAARQVPALEGAVPLELAGFDDPELALLVERRLISRDLADAPRPRGVVVAPGEGLSVMINEEDHLRLQTVDAGLRLGEALDRVAALEAALDEYLSFAHDPEWGYLTACPTNVGTGMRASVLAHLPGLVLTRRIGKLMRAATAMNLAVRGFHGEGTEVQGNFVQISNQTTLGRDEHEVVSRLDRLVRSLIKEETEATETMWDTARVALEDKIHRAHAVLRDARTLRGGELLSLASAVRLGRRLELPGLPALEVLNGILVLAQPAHLARLAGRTLSEEERRVVRAGFVRDRLAGVEREPGNGRRGSRPQDPGPDAEKREQ